ncbi:hypothetical protein C1I98_11095 [Spongiactinospora gelatinilytica]|uniref:Uncharacterized protein n=1 Tax=Spongiactinospora gelatinilytica TaxID=2666298 RepID=A0A2W2IID9_9ACTN|nr:hypothetical protein [Spongiactinospora gelatinilytica]PZG49854.1 hypothetical protein C1I98_11095 [Spongiactinospora gelatinilytica]
MNALYHVAKAAGGAMAEPPHVTVVTDTEGRRYGAWRAVIVRLAADALPGVDDGTWRLYANGRTQPHTIKSWPVDQVRTDILPHLDRGHRVAVTETPWLTRAGITLTYRILERRDGMPVAVDEALWEPLTELCHQPLWQAGGPLGPLAWAEDETARAEALLMPVKLMNEPRVPDSYRDMAARIDGQAVLS